MKSRMYCAGFIAAVLCMGCASNLDRDRPFSDAWANYNKHEREFRARKERIRGDEGIVLVGDSKKSRAAVYMDESGNPRLRVGKGWSVDMDYGGSSSVKVKYKLKWKSSKQHWEPKKKQ
ncbi:MAG TPA: hypothetical protein PLI09_14440 [Candidatus Hydrogenedentes bacterium]|nr:hypothetical protein [Candidatus Hydrogenedentota bacterium]